jgi:hypothetical protein
MPLYSLIGLDAARAILCLFSGPSVFTASKQRLSVFFCSGTVLDYERADPMANPSNKEPGIGI